MINRIHIESMDQLTPIMVDQDFRPDLQRFRSNYVYRGMSDASFKMETSLHRCCGPLQKELEPHILRNFAKYAVMEDPTIADSVWRQMILGQHYGLPTRLLDFTRSALIGLHFAVTEDDMEQMDEHDCMLWRIDMDELHALLPGKYQAPIRSLHTEVFTTDMLNQTTNSLSEYDEDMGTNSMVIIEPPSLNTRIVNQYSFFAVVPSGIRDVEAFLDEYTSNTMVYIIDKSLRWRVRDMLDSLNVSERIVYPGLDGLSRWIGRHYYVMKGLREKNAGTHPIH